MTASLAMVVGTCSVAASAPGVLEGGEKADVFQFGALDSLLAAELFDKVLDFQTGRDRFDMPEPGTEANYIAQRRFLLFAGSAILVPLLVPSAGR